MRALTAVAIVASLAIVPSCKQAPPKEGAYSCWLGNVCEDYTADLPSHKQDCTALSAEWEKHACPSDNLIGTCITDKHQSRMYYGGSANAFTADTASASCEHEFHGTWTAK